MVAKVFTNREFSPPFLIGLWIHALKYIVSQASSIY